MERQPNVLNLFVEFRFQLFNMKTLFYFELRVTAGMIENLKTRDITLIPTTFRSTKMFKNVGIFVPKEMLIDTSVEMPTVRAIDNFVYMMTSTKWRPGTILKRLYPPQNFVPAFLSTVVWSLESQSPGKRTDRASIQSNQKWLRLKCVEEFCIRSRTAAPKLSSDSLTCYEAKGNLR